MQDVIQTGVTFLEKMPDKATKLELLNTLRTMSAGKIFVELERARMTRMLADMKEKEGNVNEAADVLQEVQVETIGSMEVREKAAFLLDQMRLCLAKKDWIRAEIVANKVNTKILNDEKFQDLKLKHYNQMIEYHSQYNHYLDICKAYKEIYSTPCVQADASQWKPALTKTVMFLCLSPFDSEVSDLLHRIKAEKKIEEMPTLQGILTQFTAEELMRWPVPYEAEWKSDPIFSSGPVGKDRWDDFHKRVVQHNIRIIGQFYQRISAPRLCQLLGLDDVKTEAYVSEMVSSKQLFAKIDRPTGIVTFARKQDANDVLNNWANDISELLNVVDRTTHLINMENIRYGKAGKAKPATETVEAKD
jgi:26S proteasome regulatory subunit N5